MEHFQSQDFQRRIATVLEKVEQILNSTKRPVFAHDASHEYRDKFKLTERAVNSTLTALGTVLESLGVTQEKMKVLQTWARDNQSVTMRFELEFQCKFLRTEERKVDSKQEHVTSFGDREIRSKTVTTLTEHLWEIDVKYRVMVFAGTVRNESLVEGAMSEVVVTVDEERKPPFNEFSRDKPEEFQLSTILKLLENRSGVFVIDRSKKDCFTPTENTDVEALGQAFAAMRNWFTHIANRLLSIKGMSETIARDKTSRDVPNPDNLFIPILPAFAPMEEEEKEKKGPKQLISMEDVDRFMEAHKLQLNEALRIVGTNFPGPQDPNARLFSSQEAGLFLLASHVDKLMETYFSCLNYMRDLLRAQLIEAIGKEVTPSMVEDYMRSHYRKLFQGTVFCPFSYDIKRDGFAPEGTLSIEASGLNAATDSAKEIQTCVMKREGGEVETTRMFFRLNASSRVEMQGPQFVHGYLSHRFSVMGQPNLQLVARARQFSSFVLLVGRIVAKDEFEPKHAIIVQNKDLVLLPLLFEPLPTAKAFRDAIESLSPEQQKFAQAIRGMQLESTLFAVAVVEIKPQLELLLKLPSGSLTKEIKLTQDLVKLFIDYQVPCDLLTYDGEEDAPLKDKIAVVRGHANAVLEMIKDSREQDLKTEREVATNKFFGSVAESTSSTTTFQFGSSSPTAYSPGIPPGAVPAFSPVTSGFGGMGGGGSPQPTAFPMTPNHHHHQQQQQQQQQQREKKMEDRQTQSVKNMEEDEEETSGGNALDLTKLPARMDARVEELDTDAALRPTKITPGDMWTLQRYANLIAREPTSTSLYGASLNESKSKAMDLLDALSRSGDLPLTMTQLHVVLASTHCFDDTVMNCVLKKNHNPLDSIERSSLILSSSILGKRPADLIRPSHLPRIQAIFPRLLE